MLHFDETYSPLTSDEIIAKARANMDASRFEHCIGVSETARHLAHLNGYDENKAALTGFIHDYAKQVSDADFIAAIKTQGFDLELLKWNRLIWHGIVGTYFIKRDLKIMDAEILRAVWYHTTGAPKMTALDKIVFVADYIEPRRSFAGVDQARQVSFANLDAGVGYELTHTLEFLLAKRARIYPQTLLAYNVWGAEKGE